MLVDQVISASSYAVMSGKYWVYRVPPRSEDTAPVLGDRLHHDLWGVMDDGEERTLIFAAQSRPPDMPAEGYGPLVAFRIRVSKPFAAPGFLAAVCAAIASTDTSLLVMSTFTFDYVFVREGSAEIARTALEERGLQVEP